MSVPLYFDDPFFDDVIQDIERQRQRRLFDQHFGMGARPRVEDYWPARTRRYVTRDVAPVKLHRQNTGTSEIVSGKDKVEMKLDVQHFTPEDLTVKISDNMVVVEAKHEEKADEHGTISRQFTRKYELPEDVDQDQVVSHLSKDGILTITAPRKLSPGQQKEEKPVPLRVDKDDGRKKEEKK